MDEELLSQDADVAYSIGKGIKSTRKINRCSEEYPDLFLCTSCNIYKKWDDFHKRLDGIAFYCKECSKKYCEINSARRNAGSRKYREENKDHVEEYRICYYEENKELLRAKAALHGNLPDVKKAKNERWLIRSHTIPIVAIRHRLKCLIRVSLRRLVLKNKKNDTKLWKTLLDYSVQELKSCIESQFVGDMSWDEYLKGNIHVDHKVPITAFTINSYDDEDFKICWSLENLQPMWAKDNQIKGNRIKSSFGILQLREIINEKQVS